MRVLRFVLLTLTPFGLSLLAVTGVAKPLVIGADLSLPPWIDASTEQGIQLDIFRAALIIKGHHVNKFVFESNPRVMDMLRRGEVDGVVNDLSGAGPNWYPTDPVVEFDNVAISLRKNNFIINSIEDLSDYSVVSFEGSSDELGEKFELMAESNPRYKETYLQYLQILKLFTHSADVIVLDNDLFEYYRMRLQKNTNLDQPVTVHRIFPLLKARAAFSDPEITQDFNSGLKILKDIGEYQKIFDRYTNPNILTPD